MFIISIQIWPKCNKLSDTINIPCHFQVTSNKERRKRGWIIYYCRHYFKQEETIVCALLTEQSASFASTKAEVKTIAKWNFSCCYLNLRCAIEEELVACYSMHTVKKNEPYNKTKTKLDTRISNFIDSFLMNLFSESLSSQLDLSTDLPQRGGGCGQGHSGGSCLLQIYNTLRTVFNLTVTLHNTVMSPWKNYLKVKSTLEWFPVTIDWGNMPT